MLSPDHLPAGGITELNFNIRSTGANLDIGGLNTDALKGTVGGTEYVMNIGLDLRLINTRTLEVVDVISYQKQIIAHQVGGGVFKIGFGMAGDLSVGEGSLEPLLGVRSVIERATVEMVANLYGMPGPQACMHSDPLRKHHRRPDRRLHARLQQPGIPTMPRHAKTRIVGMIAAIPLSLLWFGTAISQSVVTNNQVQNGNVVSSDELDVVTETSDATAAATSTGNSLTGSVVAGSLNVQSTQVLDAAEP